MSLITINLTIEQATDTMKAAGVCEPDAELKKEIIKLLRFDSRPTEEDIANRAELIAELAVMADVSGHDESDGIYPEAALIDGPAFLIPSLEKELILRHLWPRYIYIRDGLVDFVTKDILSGNGVGMTDEEKEWLRKATSSQSI